MDAPGVDTGCMKGVIAWGHPDSLFFQDRLQADRTLFFLLLFKGLNGRHIGLEMFYVVFLGDAGFALSPDISESSPSPEYVQGSRDESDDSSENDKPNHKKQVEWNSQYKFLADCEWESDRIRILSDS